MDATAASLTHNNLHFHMRKRIVMAVTAQSPAGPVRIVNTHLDNRINRGAKREQLREVRQFFAGYDGPCIPGGDFTSANFFDLATSADPRSAKPARGDQSGDATAWIQHAFAQRAGNGAFPGTEARLDLSARIERARIGSYADRVSDHNSVWVTIGLRL